MFVCIVGLSSYASQLATLLDTDMDPDERKIHLNTLKMTSYLVCQFIDVFEASTKPDTVVAGKVIIHTRKSIWKCCLRNAGSQKTFVFYILSTEAEVYCLS